jgi:hypothetical protein
MMKRAAVAILAGLVACLTIVQQSGGRTATVLAGDVPILTCTGDSLKAPGERAKTCVTSDPADGVAYRWYGYGLVSGVDQTCAVWNIPGPKYVYVTNVRTGDVSVCMTMVEGTGMRNSGVPIIPDVPRPMMAINSDGTEMKPVSQTESPVRPASLAGAYPNPFNPETVIRYSLFVTGDVRLSVYNALGQEVALLVNELQPAGTYQIGWDASSLPAGLYFVRLEAVEAGHSSNMRMETGKLLLVK